jgi:hypothetical protein
MDREDRSFAREPFKAFGHPNDNDFSILLRFLLESRVPSVGSRVRVGHKFVLGELPSSPWDPKCQLPK